MARVPVLWLFTDRARLGDPCAAAARLPVGLCGVVFRDDGMPGRAAAGRQLAVVCRQRRLALVVAGDWRLAAALRAGVHLRGGERPAALPRWLGLAGGGLLTSSAHDRVELLRARRAGAAIVFLSPAFATASHPGGRWLGPVRWNVLAGVSGMGVAALGGIDGVSVRRLSRRRCAGAGAIGALG